LSKENDLADDGAGWFVSSFSNSGGSCVKVKLTRKRTFVRDSKDQRAAAPTMCVSQQGWAYLLAEITKPS